MGYIHTTLRWWEALANLEFKFHTGKELGKRKKLLTWIHTCKDIIILLLPPYHENKDMKEKS